MAATKKDFDPTAATDQASGNDAPETTEATDQEEQATTHKYTGAQYVPMPPGGLRALAGELFPDDRDNPESMNQHVSDLLVLNRDTLRTEESYTAGQQVRIS